MKNAECRNRHDSFFILHSAPLVRLLQLSYDTAEVGLRHADAAGRVRDDVPTRGWVGRGPGSPPDHTFGVRERIFNLIAYLRNKINAGFRICGISFQYRESTNRMPKGVLE